MAPLRVLMTIQTLEGPAGGSLYVRDFALELFRQGHHPYVYCRRLGSVSSELLNAGIPVVDSVDRLTEPDIIHGNSPIETVAAMLRFPNTPAIFVGHGWGSPDALPPKLPAIVKYLAVGQHARDAMIYLHGIAEDRIVVHQNPVDLERFRARGPLPANPKRALVLSNSITEANHLGLIQEVCAAAGIALDVVGLGMGTMRLDPENILGDYDLVFGNGRAALEALASGCAVILAHGMGFGELLTTENYEILRLRNFGQFTVFPGRDAATLLSQIRRYDPADVASLTERVRRCEGLFVATSVLVEHYRDAISEFQPARDGSWGTDRLAAARFLDTIAPTSNTFFLAQMMAPVEQRARTAEAKLRLLGDTLGMNPLPETELSKIQIRLLNAAKHMEPEESSAVIVQVVNGSNALLSSLGSHAVNLSYHWVSDQGRVMVLFEGLRSELYPPLPTGARFNYTVGVKAPEVAGRYILRLTMVQEGVAWLDEMGVFCETPVEIEGATATAVSPPATIVHR